VAAENFWGSIAAQLGGEKAQVHSIIVNPATDPHTYQPTAQDARTMAGAKLAIVNGLGYDEWAPRQLAASPLSGRVTLSVGQLLGLSDGANPHRWYFPANVYTVARQIARDYERLEPSARGYFEQQQRVFETQSLARYDELRREIRERYAGTPVGYSESIFQGLGEDLGLKLLTPYSFVKAIAEGGEVTAQDKRTVDGQAEHREIEVWVFNSQNVTPDVRRVNELARAAHIPIATVTETLSPPTDSFEQWQVAELERLARALHAATGR
jgi:zinc/manganese transport system substrate-binding protein